MRKQGNLTHSEEQNKSPETNPKETTTIKMLNELRKLILEQNKNINNIKNKKTRNIGAEEYNK